MTNAEKRGQALRKQCNALFREQCNTLKLTIESIEGTSEHGRIKDLEAIVSILNAMLDSTEERSTSATAPDASTS